MDSRNSCRKSNGAGSFGSSKLDWACIHCHMCNARSRVSSIENIPVWSPARSLPPPTYREYSLRRCSSPPRSKLCDSRRNFLDANDSLMEDSLECFLGESQAGKDCRTTFSSFRTEEAEGKDLHFSEARLQYTQRIFSRGSAEKMPETFVSFLCAAIRTGNESRNTSIIARKRILGKW